jgi:O-antigen/teichoic acid export membrane protein
MLVQRLYLGQNRIVMFNAYELTTRSLVLVATFIVLYLMHQPLWLYFLTYGAVFAFSSILFCARQEISVSSAIRIDVGLLRSALAYGYRPYVATLLPFVFSRVGLYFVNSMVGAEDAGYYSVAMQANDLFLIVPGVIGQLLFPRVSADNSDSKLTLKAFRFTLVLMLPLFVVGQLFAAEIIMILFGAEFLPAVPMMRVLFIGGFLSGLGLILSHDLAGRGYPLFMVLVWLPLNIVNVILNFLLIPNWGAVGTAAAAATTFFIGFLSIVIYFKSYVRIDSWSPFVPHGSDFRDLAQSIRTSITQIRSRR